MKSILITGCNRGLGLGLVKNLLKDTSPPKSLIATCRDIGKAEELKQIAEKNKNLHIVEFDVNELNTYDDFAKKIEKIVGDDGLNVLLNNAGVSTKFTRLGLVKADQLFQSFTTNTVAPIMLAKALLPLLKQASTKNADKQLGVDRSAIINMSSFLGSVELNNDGGFYPYRCSKAALNMATKTMSIDLKKEGILVTCLHPGWVKTDMGGNNAPLDVDTSTKSIIKLLHNLGEEHNGSFYQWDGTKLSW